jgi:hypothetical protein
LKKSFLFSLIFLVFSAPVKAGDIWACKCADAGSVVLTNPQVIQFTLYMQKHHTSVVTYTENSVEEQKKGKCDIFVGEDHPDHQVRFGAYSFDWSTNQLTVFDVDGSPHPAEYNKCLGAKIKVDSSYPGYSSKPLTDCSFVKKSNFKARERAWASAESSKDHWIQVVFDKPVTLNKVRLYWAWDKGIFYQSSKVHISYLDTSGHEVDVQNVQSTNDVIEKGWKTKDSDLQQTQWTFSPVVTKQLTVTQNPGGGNPKRPNLMWISQVWAY